MKSESRIFNLLAVFLFASAALYGVWTSKTTYHTDWVGTTALVLSGLLCGMCGQFFSLVARRIEPRPEDRSDAEISEGAGDLGFFSPGSYWPFGIAVAATVTGLGVAYWFPWLIALGVIAVLMAVTGLLFEYYTKPGEH
ncbi:cytochrome c oxidase subunit 4 [Cryptosporangium aurantiacum]|uniref:Cytochrome c oxidase polypeptide 4 n=1 Tax=Cryptosporangium aurantiacum TaxID=134849 RepID=A0A1M7R7I7_9ACTN|nr:cytochrome c oxidase subunit 4 [Cryptosporangium aurantiacum]SHN42295.1 Cytochrome c oxidase subunit IV [Cryptosporangium aurantiacum]